MKEQHKTWQLQPIGTTWKGVGLYHITLTIPNRQPLLGTLQIPDKDIMLAFIKSTPLGQAVLDCQRAISEHYPQIQVLHYCLMPDHLHTYGMFAIPYLWALKPQYVVSGKVLRK